MLLLNVSKVTTDHQKIPKFEPKWYKKLLLLPQGQNNPWPKATPSSDYNMFFVALSGIEFKYAHFMKLLFKFCLPPKLTDFIDIDLEKRS